MYMENNSDKQLRDKLSGTEFPFDPQAWEQMEAMLDKKKKRRGFFWWWTGGVAAVLVLAIGSIGWGLFLMEEDDKQIVEKLEIGNQKSENTIVAVSSGSEPEKAKVKSEKLKVNGPVEKSEVRNQKSEINTVKAGNTKSENTKNKNSIASIVNPSNLSAGKHGQRHARVNLFSKGKKQLATSNKQQHNNSKQQTTNNKPATAVQTEIEMLNTASAKNSSEENISLSRMEASLLNYVSENATTSFDKKEEDVLPKQKKKIFNYSIGVLANVTGASVGKQVGIPEQPTAPYFFCSKPSYMVGFTHDFLFVNRVAITNSVLFSQTSFDVYHPKTTSFTISPGIYSSHITELAIPIGIKVYPVVKNSFRFYISTGIINHIKLKETFDYTMLDGDTVPNTTSNLFDPANFPYQTNFGIESKSLDAQIATGGETSTKDFSINKAKRYYASFYAGAGFEYVAKKHFILFAEPVFYMSLQKIGVQDKRKYNLGLSGGFRYQF